MRVKSPYGSGSPAVGAELDLSSKLSLSGGVMTGALTLSGAPTMDFHAATKSYVDSANSTGNSATATKLQTARTINGVAFDGTTNITVADATKFPVTGGTLTGLLSTQMSAPAGITVTSAGGSSSIQVMGSATQAAFITFHRAGAYAINLGLDTDNYLRYGGWSSGGGNVAFSCSPSGNFQPLRSVSFGTMYDMGTVSGNVTINFVNGQKVQIVLGAATNLTFSFPGVGNYQVVVFQDAAGNKTIGYTQTINWVGSATAPVLNAGSWGQTILSLYWDGSRIYLAGTKCNA